MPTCPGLCDHQTMVYVRGMCCLLQSMLFSMPAFGCSSWLWEGCLCPGDLGAVHLRTVAFVARPFPTPRQSHATAGVFPVWAPTALKLPVNTDGMPRVHTVDVARSRRWLLWSGGAIAPPSVSVFALVHGGGMDVHPSLFRDDQGPVFALTPCSPCNP